MFDFKFVNIGATRYVFLIGEFAIKIPRLSSWKSLLQGLLCNLQEVSFSKTKWPKLCPVVFSLPLGFLLVMPRCVSVSEEDWVNFESQLPDWVCGQGYLIPVEKKINSFGWLKGKVVALDYG